GKMNGLVLDDTRVVKAMDESEKNMFIPAGIDEKTGKATGSIISLKQLEELNKRIDRIITDMATELHNGKIPASPVNGKDHDGVCDYCDYKSVCCHEPDGKYRYIKFDTHAKCLEKLSGGDNDE
ncbi:MAG: PD-(D/E)XK nuclease family protein, partial [Acutalibacteraceae bacterium]